MHQPNQHKQISWRLWMCCCSYCNNGPCFVYVEESLAQLTHVTTSSLCCIAGLSHPFSSSPLTRTDAEFGRRQNQLSTLKGRCTDLQGKFGRGIASDLPNAGMDNRNRLFGGRESGTARRQYQDEPQTFQGNDTDG